jgi:hypothetical protein
MCRLARLNSDNLKLDIDLTQKGVSLQKCPIPMVMLKHRLRQPQSVGKFRVAVVIVMLLNVITVGSSVAVLVSDLKVNVDIYR